MSSDSPKPDSSVAAIGALPGHEHPADRTSEKARPKIVADRLLRKTDDQATTHLGQLAPQRLAEGARGLHELLDEVVRMITTVDVARRDLRPLPLIVAHRQLTTVVGDAVHPFGRPGPGAVQHNDLATSRGGALVGGSLAVQPKVEVRVLDQPVRLRSDHESVVGQTHV
jgi:hypothetical protein